MRDFVHTIQRDFPDRELFVFRHFPLQAIHRNAFFASAAAEAADAQGEFWTMHEHLLDHQATLAARDLSKCARELGLDLDRFERDRRSVEVAERIHRDIAGGHRSGVRCTPTCYINGMCSTRSCDVVSTRSAILRLLTNDA